MEYLNRTVSFGVDPCRNFHAFVCGGSDAEWRGSILDRAYQAIFINVSLELHLGETIGKSEAMVTLMRFYRSCLRPADSPLEADRQAVAFLKHINETSGLLASNATQGMLFQLITLMSLRYNIPTILSINLVSIGGSNGSLSLTFALGPSLETRWGGEMAYFRYSIIRMLLWTNTYLHSNVTIDMIDRMEMSLNLGPPDAYKSFTNTSIEEIADIIIGVSPRAFRYHISSSLPKGIEFNELANIQSSNTSVIKIAMNTFFQPNQRVVAVTLALINVFAAILDQLISLQYRKKWPHWYFHYCEMEALSFRETWRLASLEYIPQNGTLIVQQIKKDVTRAALKQLVGHCGAKYKLWHLVHDKVTKLRIRMPEENVYRDIALPTMTPNFVLNYIALKRYSQEVKVRRAQTRMSEGIMDDEKLGFRYFPEENSVYLTPSWFQQPMFYPKSEPFVNYAVIGAILAGLTHRAVGRSGQNHDANGNEKRWWTHNLDVAIAEQQNCFRREYIDVSDGEPSPSLLDEIWAISEGLELVWEDVVASGLDDGNVQINGKTFTWRQFFFIRFCSVWCNYAGTPAENAWRCNVPLKHIPGFAYSFNCSGAKAMGYRHSCSRKLPCS
ncbi:uncharacterized protein LOC8039615 [Ixodes scapularis]|nr:uncharacterized protein LOC8039615 [Ixodes scapularis]